MDEILGDLENQTEGVSPNEMQAKLSKMSFEDLQKLKAELGIKLYKEAYFGTKAVKQTNFKRLNKNRPREASSKIKPSKPQPKPLQKNVRDPRFDPLCGKFNKSTFEKNYRFVNDIKVKEKEKLKKLLRNAKTEDEKNKLKYLIRRFENQEMERLKREKAQAKISEEKREQMQALAQGKKPHFKSKYERKVGDIIDRYQELKGSGKLLKFIEKKQKKNNRKYKKEFDNDRD